MSLTSVCSYYLPESQTGNCGMVAQTIEHTAATRPQTCSALRLDFRGYGRAVQPGERGFLSALRLERAGQDRRAGPALVQPARAPDRWHDGAGGGGSVHAACGCTQASGAGSGTDGLGRLLLHGPVHAHVPAQSSDDREGSGPRGSSPGSPSSSRVRALPWADRVHGGGRRAPRAGEEARGGGGGGEGVAGQLAPHPPVWQGQAPLQHDLHADLRRPRRPVLKPNPNPDPCPNPSPNADTNPSPSPDPNASPSPDPDPNADPDPDPNPDPDPDPKADPGPDPRQACAERPPPAC
eukprot:scaffold14360_cov57-Phaeocystis_antarctica.AAC.6